MYVNASMKRLHPRQGRCFLPLKAESIRNIVNNMPTASVPQTYEIEITATSHFGELTPTLIQPNFILVKTGDINTTPLAEHICSNLDLALSGVWLKVSEEQELQTFALPDTAAALTSKQIKLRATSFSPMCEDDDIEFTVLTS